jgi:acyl-coenzyme A synthetase/AMP-(fatty) acid ligase
MLYDRWRDLARTRRGDFALADRASGRRWTFGQLADDAERGAADPEPVAFPRGTGADFILTVLRAWRDRRLVCPLEAAQPPPALAALPPGAVHLKTTSATTGAARLLAFTEAQLAADAAHIVSTMGLRPDWPNLGVISLAHSYGFSNLVLPLLLYGIPLILAGSPLPEALRAAAGEHRETALTLPAVPALWRAWHEADAIPAGVRLAICAGAPLPLPLEHAVFARNGLKIHNFYGASECGGIAYDRSPTPRAEDTLVGTALDHVTLTLDATGCLEVRSAAVAATAWPQPDPALSPGCFRTRDLAELRDGAVHLLGRAAEVINVAGRKIPPEAIERALRAHPAVRDCLVLGVPAGDAARTDVIAAVVAADGANEASLREFLLRTLPAWQVPRRWHFVPELPTNARGKLSRAEWRDRLTK